MKRNREIWQGLIAIEGIDGAGTTTLSRNLSEALADKGAINKQGCEPTGSEIGRLIREGLAGRIPMAPESLALLFAADRREHLYASGGIRSVLDKDERYITDRFLFSSLAYQSLDCPWEWVDELNSPYPLPGHLVYLGIPVDEAMKRISGRNEQDIFETETLQQRVSDIYKRSIDAYRQTGMKVLILDSRRSPEEICADSLEFVLS